jgi:cytochrome c oxidase subunit 2
MIGPVFCLMLQTRLAEHSVANIFDPRATPAATEKNLALFTFSITGGIFIVVAALLIFAIVRYRSRIPNDLEEPAQVYGSGKIELAWTVIPILIVFVLTGVTGRVIASIEDSPQPSSATHITLVGRQWWWEVHYPDFGIVTANEIHVPVSRSAQDHPTFFTLQSADVIHSFWVPQLSGKTDLIPNRDNHIWIDPREPGIYLGNCAEYCGTQHANMMLRVIVHPAGEFEKWAVAERTSFVPAAQSNPGRAVFESLACVNCHTVRGSVAAGKFGPDLTHLMRRQTIGAGVVPLTPKNLRDWVADPQEVKPGCLMPSMNLSNTELTQVVSYLEALK